MCGCACVCVYEYVCVIELLVLRGLCDVQAQVPLFGISGANGCLYSWGAYYVVVHVQLHLANSPIYTNTVVLWV